MICGESEFVHIGWVTKWIHKISLFLVSVRQQDSPRAFGLRKVGQREKNLRLGKEILFTLLRFIQT